MLKFSKLIKPENLPEIQLVSCINVYEEESCCMMENLKDKNEQYTHC